MALLRFTKVPKHQKFEYIPRYWDPEKEALLERIQKAESTDAELIKSRIRGGFKTRGGYTPNNARSRQTKRSNMILVIVIFALILISYLAIQVYLPILMNLME
ncbi:MAG: hypothetical protein D6714_21390 [Bacteroidetes bacterium]|nr:MAG: hypothetical protein D6714_21390 [Bacteroidota bacterium]